MERYLLVARSITHAQQMMKVLDRAGIRTRVLRANLQQEPYCREPAQLLGPAPASVARVNYSYRYQLTLVCRNSAAIRRLQDAQVEPVKIVRR